MEFWLMEWIQICLIPVLPITSQFWNSCVVEVYFILVDLDANISFKDPILTSSKSLEMNQA